jgi:putative transposase
LAYREALNFTSEAAFDNDKSSNGAKLQKLVYNELRARFGLGSQMACNVPRQVAATYKSLWTKVKQNVAAIKAGHTKKRYKGLDKAPKYVSRTVTLNYQRDYSFKTEQRVSINTLSGRIVVPYDGYNKHLQLIANCAKIGAAKIVYQRSSKTYYLMVSLEVETPTIEPTNITSISGVDVGQRYLAVEVDLQNKAKFYSGKAARHKANRYHKARKTLRCGHTSKANRPNKGLLFRCECCGFELHADLLGSRNIALRTLLVRQDWMSTGILSASPNVSDEETKAEILQRFSELRWSPDASSDLSVSGSE